jgi:hypothetical protein
LIHQRQRRDTNCTTPITQPEGVQSAIASLHQLGSPWLPSPRVITYTPNTQHPTPTQPAAFHPCPPYQATPPVLFQSTPVKPLLHSGLPCYHPLEQTGLGGDRAVSTPTNLCDPTIYISTSPTQPSFPLFYTYLGTCQSNISTNYFIKALSTSCIDVIAHFSF